MKFYSRRTAAIVLAVALALPTAVSARPQERDHIGRYRQIVDVIKKIQKLFGVSANDDIPIPPVPTPPPPPQNP